MKIFIILITFVFLTASCSKKTNNNYVILSGEIENPNSDSIYILNDFEQKIATISLTKKNTFCDTFEVTTGYYKLYDGKETTSLFLKSGYNLNITINTKTFDESIKYKGTGENENNYLVKKALLTEVMYPNLVSYYKNETNNESKFLNYIDSSKAVFINLLNKENNLDIEFRNLEYKNISLENDADILTYQDVFTNYGEEPSAISKNFPNPLNKFDINNDSLALLPLYSYLAEKKITAHIQKSFDEDTNSTKDFSIYYIKTLGQLVSNQKCKDLLACITLKSNINHSQNPKLLLNIADSLTKNKIYKQWIAQQKESLNKIEPGKPSPIFELYDINEKLVSLKDLKGKFVYIDIWATWCGPCRNEIQPLAELQTKLKNKNIVFVSICQEDEKENWIKKVTEKKMGGIQLFAPDNTISFLKDYMVSGIPRFILIDEEGKIINANAKRPSNADLLKELNMLLK